MHLLFTFAILLTILGAELAPPRPLAQPIGRIVVALALAMAALGSWKVVAGVAQRPLAPHRQLRRLVGAAAGGWTLVGLWLLLGVALPALIQWPRIVRFNFGLADTILLDEILIFLPPVVAWFCVSTVAADLAARGQGRKLPRSGRYALALRGAVGDWGLLLLPALILCGCDDLARVMAPSWNEIDRFWFVAGPATLVVGLVFPWLVQQSLGAQSLEKTSHGRESEIRTACLRLGLRADRIVLWPTRRRMANAAVCGFVRPWRYLLVTDRLLDCLSPRQLEAVLAHEAGHLLGNHLLLRMALFASPLVAAAAVWRALPAACEHLAHQLAGFTLLGNSVAIPLATALVVGFWSYALPRASHALEHDADLRGARLLDGPHGPTIAPGALGATSAASEQMVDALLALALANPAATRRTTWLHPSIADRVRFLRNTALDPAHSARLAGGISCLRRSLAVGYVAAALSLFW